MVFRRGRLPWSVSFAGEVSRMWDLYQMGVSCNDIADQVPVSRAAVSRMVNASGGIRPKVGVLSGRCLDMEERFKIKELLVEGLSLREIAKQLKRSPSTISREVARASIEGTRGRYSPVFGERMAVINRSRPKPLKIPSDPVLLAEVQAGLDRKLSPEQIVGRLRHDHPDDPRFVVSHETIYKTIYLQARGGLKRDLQALTRTGRTVRRPDRSAHERRGRIPGMVSIWDRPAEALDRSVPGHWEGDLIVGKNGKSSIGTVVERHSNYLILVYMDPSKNRVEALRDGLVGKLGGLPDTLRRTLTWDQGMEMSDHRRIAEIADIDIYFADPHSPWQRASNENTNGLLRQYFPKGTDLSVYSQMDLDLVADEMNRRPRKRLDFETPFEVLSQYLLR